MLFLGSYICCWMEEKYRMDLKLMGVGLINWVELARIELESHRRERGNELPVIYAMLLLLLLLLLLHC